MRKILFIFLSLIIFLTACESKRKEFKEIDIGAISPNYYVGVNHGITEPDNEIRELIYDGKPITVNYYIDCYYDAAEFGLVIFVNGIRQPYIFNDEKKETLMKIEPFNSGEKKYFTVTFTPVIGKAGDVLSVLFCTVLEPRAINNNLESPIFAYFHSYSQQTPWKLIMKADSNAQPIQYNKLDVSYRDGEIYETEDTVFRVNKEETIIFSKKGKVHLDFEFYFGEENKYCFLLFINHQLTPVQGKYYHEITNKPNQFTVWSVDVEWDDSNNSFLYGLLIPINNEISEHDQLHKTESKLLIRG